ncbi:MAG TPA: DUF3455 domain-containing protein [Steroidobacteraceae bacterium]|nr:DUF3455 domain-containing protein [Steroidobacteraceae bacterium]
MSSVTIRTALPGLLLLVAMGAGAARGDDVPAAVAAPGRPVIMKLHAQGVQIYECKAAAGGMSWRFREPLAVLLQDGRTVGHHFGGPTWELDSGSAVVGKVESQAPGRTPKDVALLKLTVVARRGAGGFDEVTGVQRLDTRGGAFGGPCNRPGALHLEPYAAEYVFLGD